MRSSIGVRRTRVNGKRLALVIIIAAAIVAAVLYVSYMFTEIKLDDAMEQQLLASGTFVQGVSVGGIDVSGLTMEQAQIAVSPEVNKMLNSGQIEFTVQGVEEPYHYSLQDMGLTVDPTPALREAMLYGREGRRWDLEHEDPEPKDFILQRVFNIGEVTTQINAAESTDEWGEPAVNGNYRVAATKDEDSLTTGGSLEKTEPHDGYAIDKQSVITTIENQIKDENYQPFEAPVEILPSTSAGGSSDGTLSLMGDRTTNFEKSDDNRKFNVWKMASILNGACIEPGDVFSINDIAGDRNAENGWKEASGIENGVYTPQYGGGICQVSSTLYNACLEAELEMVNRVPHTIAASYVPKGMDATISTGGPDFKFKNNYDHPVYLIFKTDGWGGSITAEVWGTDPRDYTVKVYSEEDVAEREDPPPIQYQRNSELSSNAVMQVRKGQQKEVWNVYMDKIDGDGNVIEEHTLVTTSTYKAIPPLVELGSGITVPPDGTPLSQVSGNKVDSDGSDIQASGGQTSGDGDKDDEQTTSKPTAAPSHGGGSESKPTQKPSQAPEPTKEPSQAPEPTPEPTKEPAPPVSEAPQPSDEPSGGGDGGESAE